MSFLKSSRYPFWVWWYPGSAHLSSIPEVFFGL